MTNVQKVWRNFFIAVVLGSLGVWGLIWMMNLLLSDRPYGWVPFSLFIATGIAVLIYDFMRFVVIKARIRDEEEIANAKGRAHEPSACKRECEFTRLCAMILDKNRQIHRLEKRICGLRMTNRALRKRELKQ